MKVGWRRVVAPLIGLSVVAMLSPGGCGGSTKIISSEDGSAGASSLGGAGPDSSAGGLTSVAPCASDKDCAATRQLCDSNRKVCVDCRADPDCATGALCAGGVCQPFISCVNSRDCPTDQVCDMAKWRCVQCIGNGDCPSADLCAASLCQLKCASDKDCVSVTGLCDKAKGYCVGCLKDADCALSSYCDAGTCASRLCAPLSSVCLRTALFTCDGHGAVYSSVDCTNGCSESGGAHCIVGLGTGGSGGTGGVSGTGGIETGGVSGTGGAGGGSGAGGAPPSGGSPGTGGASGASFNNCPTGLPGPALIEVPAPVGAAVPSYCIDATEVTNGQYAAFLSAKGSDTSGQDAWCAWNTDYAPTWTGCPWCPQAPCTAPGSDYPASCVDWCDAYAYCKWAGKHLCGKIGGGTNGFSDYATATLSEWFNACSAGGAQKYPYGNAYDGTACVDSDYDGTLGFSAVSDVLRPVGTATRCHGTISPFDAIYDLSGNVWEWDDSCNGVTGSGDYCYERGGSFPNGTGQPSSGVLDLACDYGGLQNRSSFSFNAGFRCCAASL